ncbi:MAG: S8 family serine peptidase, partial [Mycobacterium sp.]
LGAALRYAAVDKNVVIVAAAGNDGEEECAQNPLYDPVDTADPRDWHQVQTVSSPSWFSDFVLSVGAVDNTGAPIAASLAGPWVGVSAPGVEIMGLSPQNGGPVNAYSPSRAGEPNQRMAGTSFAAAYVSGVVALVRAKFPGLTAHQVIDRIQQTAHNPARGVDNQVGYGLINPTAALTYNVPTAERFAPGSETRILAPPPPPPVPDHRARNMAVLYIGVLVAVVLIAAVIARAGRSR